MPTGYTSKLHDGPQPFEDFVMMCARAMGACVTMREQSLSTPIPEEFEPSDYYARRVEEALAGLAEAEAWSPDVAAAKAADDFERRRASREQINSRSIAMRDRYQEMLTAVEAWTPPTSGHVGLKTFMVEQISESMKFDCGEMGPTDPCLSGPEFKAQRIAEMSAELHRAAEAHENELRRTRERNEWIRALRASLESKANLG